MCFEAGLVQGQELYLDATKVEANASLDSTRSRSLVENYLEGVFAGEERPVEGFTQEANAPDALGAVGPSVPQERKVLAETNARGHRWNAGSERQQREVATNCTKKAGDRLPLRPRAGPEVIVRTTTHVKAGPAGCVA
jgi:hypothetical protein